MIEKITNHNVVFLLCDMQEKLLPAISKTNEVMDTTIRLLKASEILETPLIVTEQYPEKLGHTDPKLPIGHAIHIFPKTQFSMIIAEIKDFFENSPHIKNVVLFGIETHICIEQTADDLIEMGLNVYIVANAVSSRSKEDRVLALRRLERIGCHITTFESILFKILNDKKHPKFAEARKLVATTSDSGLFE